MKIFMWEPSCSTRTDRRTDEQTNRRTDMSKLICAFRSFADALKNDEKSIANKHFREGIIRLNQYKQKIREHRNRRRKGKMIPFSGNGIHAFRRNVRGLEL